MCDPVSATVAAVGVGGAAYSNKQAKKAQSKVQAAAEEQARLQREAEAQRAAQEMAWREQQAAAQRAFEEQQRRAQEEMVRQQMEMQRRMQEEQQRAYQEMVALQEAQAEAARQAEIRRQQAIQQGQSAINEVFGQFNDDFYQQRQQAYQEYARPQLERQYQDAMAQLVRNLSRSGNLSSSLRGQSMADLQRQYDEGLATIANNAATYAQQARAAIEAARSNLVAQNASLADPGQVRSLAEAQARSLGQAQPFTPLGSLISAIARGAAEPVGVNKKAAAGAGVGLLSNNLASNTVTVVN